MFQLSKLAGQLIPSIDPNLNEKSNDAGLKGQKCGELYPLVQDAKQDL